MEIKWIHKKTRITESLMIPISLSHPTKNGGDRVWVGFMHHIYRVDDDDEMDTIVFDGMFMSNRSDVGTEKQMRPSLTRNLMDGKNGFIVDDVEEWLWSLTEQGKDPRKMETSVINANTMTNAKRLIKLTKNLVCFPFLSNGKQY